MDKDRVQGKWEKFKAELKSKYAVLTEDEPLEIQADFQGLVGHLQDQYGITREEAVEKVKEIEKQ